MVNRSIFVVSFSFPFPAALSVTLGRLGQTGDFKQNGLIREQGAGAVVARSQAPDDESKQRRKL